MASSSKESINNSFQVVWFFDSDKFNFLQLFSNLKYNNFSWREALKEEWKFKANQ